MDKMECIKAICELIEDKQYPAKRNITDYVVCLIQEFDYEFGKKADEYIEKFYKKCDRC